MVIVLTVIAVLMLASVIYLKKFMSDMAVVEGELISEIRQMKEYLRKMSEK